MRNNKVTRKYIDKAVLFVDNITNSCNGFPVSGFGDTGTLEKIDMSKAKTILHQLRV